MKYIAFLGTLLFLFISVAPQQAQAQDNMPLPSKLQAAIFKKVFALNTTLQSRGDFDVLVVHNGTGDPDVIVQSFAAVGISARAQSLSGAEGALDNVGVVYLMPGSESLGQVARDKQLLSITGEPAMVAAGNAAIGLELEAGKPKIIVHRSQLQAEGQEVSANLLKLARVIG